MNTLILQVVEQTEVSKRWHFYAFNNSVLVVINKNNDEINFDWKIHSSSRTVIKNGSSISYNDALHEIENYLNNEILAKDVS